MLTYSLVFPVVSFTLFCVFSAHINGTVSVMRLALNIRIVLQEMNLTTNEVYENAERVFFSSEEHVGNVQ